MFTNTNGTSGANGKSTKGTQKSHNNKNTTHNTNNGNKNKSGNKRRREKDNTNNNNQRSTGSGGGGGGDDGDDDNSDNDKNDDDDTSPPKKRPKLSTEDELKNQKEKAKKKELRLRDKKLEKMTQKIQMLELKNNQLQQGQLISALTKNINKKESSTEIKQKTREIMEIKAEATYDIKDKTTFEVKLNFNSNNLGDIADKILKLTRECESKNININDPKSCKKSIPVLTRTFNEHDKFNWDNQGFVTRCDTILKLIHDFIHFYYKFNGQLRKEKLRLENFKTTKKNWNVIHQEYILARERYDYVWQWVDQNERNSEAMTENQHMMAFLGSLSPYHSQQLISAINVKEIAVYSIQDLINNYFNALHDKSIKFGPILDVLNKNINNKSFGKPLNKSVNISQFGNTFGQTGGFGGQGRGPSNTYGNQSYGRGRSGIILVIQNSKFITKYIKNYTTN